MIYDKIENVDIYLSYLKESPLRQALLKIKEGKFSVVDTPDLRCNSINFQTLSESSKRYEAHRCFYDIHVVLEGEEFVRICNIADLTAVTDYVEDIYFGDYQGDSDLQFCLRPGYFLVVFPEDAHKVGFHPDSETARTVHKAVFKIKA